MYPALQNAETINRLVEQGELPATRRFRIVKPQNNIPVLGVCEYCNAEFTADPQTVGRPQDAHSITPSSKNSSSRTDARGWTPANTGAQRKDLSMSARPQYTLQGARS
jgi:hypothetical protein